MSHLIRVAEERITERDTAAHKRLRSGKKDRLSYIDDINSIRVAGVKVMDEVLGEQMGMTSGLERK